MVGSLTVGQLLVLRKFALLKLTAIMERYCPTHRTGWNWELPKFMRKTKMPDPKGTYAITEAIGLYNETKQNTYNSECELNIIIV